MKIIEAQMSHMDIVRVLFREYQQTVAEDGSSQCFAGYEDELAALPADYIAPKGVIYIAVTDDESVNQETAIGCVAIRQREGKPDEAELKRLYVRQYKRSAGTGKRLMDKVIQFTKDQQYTSVFLETVKSMEAAKSLYARYGFESVSNPEQEKNSSIECYQFVIDKDVA